MSNFGRVFSGAGGSGGGAGGSSYIYLSMSSNFTATAAGDEFQFDTALASKDLSVNANYEVELSGGIYKCIAQCRTNNAPGDGSKAQWRRRVTSGSNTDSSLVGVTSVNSDADRAQAVTNGALGFAIIDARSTTYYAVAWLTCFNSSGTCTALAEGSWASIERIG